MYIGIDVGGTNLKAGLVDGDGAILKTLRMPLDFQGPEAFAKTLADLSRSLVEGDVSAVESVGMGLPGAVDGGDVLFTTNIPMEHVPLEQLFRRHLNLPLLLGNDADCAAVGEYFLGAGKGTRDFAVVTLGTGIGAGLILDGRLRGGLASSEAGHMSICRDGGACNCGRRGCWEYYASATGLIRQTREAMAAHPESALHALAERDGCVEGRTAFQAAADGDETALAVCRQYVAYLADGITNLVNILRPEAVAIGGGVAAAPEELLLEPLRRRVERESFSRHGGRTTRIVRSELGNDAGIIGAALLGRVI
ncbi:ROK family protein [uncultured Oscillibacter sp.]|uniref:ROK family protein n=1 Tax=uncultured Oscillibacter sp. TaxID=876091 RepID=UPI0025CD2F6E|nr:ROK family protein [uncultured Oscillibacter sp.]